MGSEGDDDLGDFDPNSSVNSDDKVDSGLIKKILNEMKSEFNRDMDTSPTLNEDSFDMLSNVSLKSPVESPKENGNFELKINGNESTNESFDSPVKDDPPATEDTPQVQCDSQDEQTEDVKEEATKNENTELTVEPKESVSNDDSNYEIEPLKKKKKFTKDSQTAKSSPQSPEPDEPINEPRKSIGKKGRRSLRNADRPDKEVAIKRSSRRMSKDFSKESVLQNAIARKEKSMSSVGSSDKQRRSSRASDDRHAKKRNRIEEPGFKGSSEANKGSLLKGKSPNLNASELLDNETDSENTSPVKYSKNSFHQENGVEEELSNQVSSSYHSENDWDKGNDSSSSFGNTGSVKAKKKSFSFSSESFQHLIKKFRIDHSPVIPEASDVPPCEPSLPPSEWPQGSCECQKNEGLYPSKSSYAGRWTCKALDSFEDRIVGCSNRVGGDVPLLRPSRTAPYLLMCDVHIARLVRHNCCPICGLFCIQGYFLQCKYIHFFHRDCVSKKDDELLCPHCGSDKVSEVKLSIGGGQYPLFLPTQKLAYKISAKMTINRGSYPTEPDLKEDEDLLALVPLKDLTFKSRGSSEGTPEKEKFSGRGFYQACRHGDTEKVYHMLEGGNCHNKDGGTLVAFHGAAGNGHLGVVHLLVQFGMPLDSLDKSQYTPLMLAVLNGHNAVVKYLVRAGANVAFKGSDGMTALHLAAKTGNLTACQYLLSAANKPVSFVDSTDDGNWTPLVWAAENNHAQVVRFLLENKADPHIKDSEMNVALHWSAFAGSMEITEDLLNHGSSVNVANAHGDTPLHIAARQGAENCVMLLLSRGAKTDVRNESGQTPKDCVLLDSSYCRSAIELNMKLKRLQSKNFFFPRIASSDISRGHERYPIQCVNNVDEDPAPKDFVYITENCVTSNLPIDRRITSLSGCKCEDNCTARTCACALSSLRCWYDSMGRLIPEFNFEDPPMIFECNQTCDCNALTCKNRVVQKGIRVRLQVCKTKKKNWGVIALKDIPKGTYVCEYIGEIISDCEADTREDDSYLFDLDTRDGECYCIDACKYGNVTRFINHSCKPNLVPVRIFVSHHDLHFPRIAFFASRDIQSNEELGFDYGEKFWIIKYKNFTCSCEEATCRYSSQTIHDTLDKYKEGLKLDDSL